MLFLCFVQSLHLPAYEEMKKFFLFLVFGVEGGISILGVVFTIVGFIPAWELYFCGLVGSIFWAVLVVSSIMLTFPPLIYSMFYLGKNKQMSIDKNLCLYTGETTDLVECKKCGVPVHNKIICDQKKQLLSLENFTVSSPASINAGLLNSDVISSKSIQDYNYCIVCGLKDTILSWSYIVNFFMLIAIVILACAIVVVLAFSWFPIIYSGIALVLGVIATYFFINHALVGVPLFFLWNSMFLCMKTRFKKGNTSPVDQEGDIVEEHSYQQEYAEI